MPHADVVADVQPIVIYPPAEDGGRRVRVGERFRGMAYGLLDVVEFLLLAGLDDIDEEWVRQSGLIEWRGGGPGVWEP
jgi:hypothetical protein